MNQKNYQKLRKPENLQAAKDIYEFLKKNKTMSQKTFDDIYIKANDIRYVHGAFQHLIQTTMQFLKDHDLMTRLEINGLIIFVATQKCFRTKSFENATIEYQYVTDLDIERAIVYQHINRGYVPTEFEGKVIAKILKLEGNVAKDYIKAYSYYHESICGSYYLDSKFAILMPIRNLKTIVKL